MSSVKGIGFRVGVYVGRVLSVPCVFKLLE